MDDIRSKVDTIALIALFWCCIAAVVAAQDHHLDRAVQYAEQAAITKAGHASLVSPDGRLFASMPSP
jgi:hypothetical protein